MKYFLILALFWIHSGAKAIQIVTEKSKVECRRYFFLHELPIYKDPSLFVEKLNLIYLDPASGWDELMKENPLLTKLHGEVNLMIVGTPRKFENFGAISRLYELADPQFSRSKKRNSSPEIVSVKACGGEYNDTIGFVLLDDLKGVWTFDRK